MQGDVADEASKQGGMDMKGDRKGPHPSTSSTPASTMITKEPVRGVHRARRHCCEQEGSEGWCFREDVETEE